MNPRALLCKLPKWLGGGHRWRRLRKGERKYQRDLAVDFQDKGVFGMDVPNRICSRCLVTRLAKARKGKA